MNCFKKKNVEENKRLVLGLEGLTEWEEEKVVKRKWGTLYTY